MSYSNTTVNLGLPQFVGTDKATWQDLNTAFAKIDSIVGAIAPAFSTESTYEVGQYVQHGGLFYKCTVEVSTAGEWSDANWTPIIITTAMQDEGADLTNFVKVDLTNGTGITSNEYAHLTIVS